MTSEIPTNEKLARLAALPSSQLAAALCELAGRNKLAEVAIARLLATPAENVERIKHAIAGIRRSKRFVHWGESAGLADELMQILDEIRRGVNDAETGLNLMSAFFQTDASVFGRSDDSSGHIGEVYRVPASELFWQYSRSFQDKNKLSKKLLKLLAQDEFSVRGELLSQAHTFLSEPQLRLLLVQFGELVTPNSEQWRFDRYARYQEVLAKQLRDADLFAQLRSARWGNDNPAGCGDIAEVYLQCGQAQTALQWLQRVPDSIGFQLDRRMRLQLLAYTELQMPAERQQTAWRIFRQATTVENLQLLLEVIGHDQRETVLADEIRRMTDSGAFQFADLCFLIDTGAIAVAREYLLAHADALAGEHYTALCRVVDAFETANEELAASLLYRRLLQDILEHARTPAYKHAARYWHKLSLLASNISDWRRFESHDAFAEGIRARHGRKQRFWSLLS